MKNLICVSAACGVGKTTVKDALAHHPLMSRWACIDTDEVGINWWDYAGTGHEQMFTDDCLARAVKFSGDRHLLFASCLNPLDYYGKIHVPAEITATYFVGMICSPEALRARLLARPAERMCGSDAFIASQIEYNAWFRQNRSKFQLFIDNTSQCVSYTADIIANFISHL